MWNIQTTILHMPGYLNCKPGLHKLVYTFGRIEKSFSLLCKFILTLTTAAHVFHFVLLLYSPHEYISQTKYNQVTPLYIPR